MSQRPERTPVQPAAADPEQQGIEVEHDGQAKLEGSHPLTVHQDADGGPLVQLDLVRGHDDQFGTAGHGQRPPGGGDDLPMLAPSAHEHADQVDLQQGSRGGRRRFLHGDLPGHLGELRQGAAKVLIAAGRQDLAGQGLGRVRVRVEQQIQGGGRTALCSGRHGRPSLIVVVETPGWGSRRTVWVGSCPVSRTLTASSRTASATARTSGATSGSWWECSERARFRERKRDLPRVISVKPPAVTMAAAAVIKAMSCGGTVGESALIFTCVPSLAGSADTSVENGLSCPAVLTAVTMK